MNGSNHIWLVVQWLVITDIANDFKFVERLRSLAKNLISHFRSLLWNFFLCMSIFGFSLFSSLFNPLLWKILNIIKKRENYDQCSVLIAFYSLQTSQHYLLITTSHTCNSFFLLTLMECLPSFYTSFFTGGKEMWNLWW